MRLPAVALPFVLAAWACEPLVTTFEDVEEARSYQAATLTDPPDSVTSMLAMTWNIKFAGAEADFWWACYGDRVLMTESEVLANLERLVAKISAVDPDILLLQEVDVQSKRSAYVDQMQYLLDHTDLNYGVYASNWRTQFVASDGLGRIDSGTAIMSRWPLQNAQRISLDLRTDQDPLTRHFYVRRNILKADLHLNGDFDLHVVSVHTAAFSQDGTKKRHIDRFKEVLDEIDAGGGRFIAGGDLNTVPPGSHMTSGFPDGGCVTGDFAGEDYSEEGAWLEGLYGAYEPVIPLASYFIAPDQSPYFTFGSKPDSLGLSRKLDYLFTNWEWLTGSALTHQDIFGPGRSLSDHVPLTAWLAIPLPAQP